MAPANFVFPPPPPPPPQTSQQSYPSHPFNQSRNPPNGNHSSYGSYRGRGQGYGSRGSTFPRGGMNQRPNYGYHGPQQQSNRGAYSSQQTVSSSSTYSPRQSQSDVFSGGFRRERPTAPRAPAAPAVPRFGLPLPSNLNAAPGALAPIKKRKREHNQLGLTPKQEEHESSEEDVDEEERLARSLGVAGKGPLRLQFTYNGRSSTLNSASELAAWLEERKRRYPTKARIEEENSRKVKQQEEARQAKKVEEDQKRRKKEEQNIQLARMKVEESIKRKQQRSFDEGTKLDRETQAIQKAEKLRRKYEKAQEKVARIAARNASPRNSLIDSSECVSVASTSGIANDFMVASHAAEGADIGALLTPTSQCLSPITAPKNINSDSLESKNDLGNDLEEKDDIGITRQGDSAPNDLDSLDSSDSLSSASDSEDSSELSSSSEDESSDSDAAPEVATSKAPMSEPVEVPKPPPPKQKRDEICRSYLRNGRCPFKERCLYKHELPKRGARQKEQQKQQLKAEKSARTKPTVPRMSLYQRMVAHEKEQEEQNILDHIIFLGEQGLLENEGKS